MFANHENWDDVKKYYQGCWIKVKECGERVYLVREVGPEETLLQSPSRGDNDEDAEVFIDMKSGYHVDYVIPKKTVYQLGSNAIILQRVPARMWRKGMDPKNTEFSSLDAIGKWSKQSLNISLIESFVNKPSYRTWQEAQEALKQEDMFSCALTNRISVSRNGNVYIDTVHVGKYGKDAVLKHVEIYGDTLSKVFTNTKLKAL